MEQLQTWGMSLCCAALAGGIVQLVSPGSAMNKIFRITVGVFFLCCVISPFTSGELSITLLEEEQLRQEQSQNGAELIQKADEYFYASARQTLEQLTQKKLAEMGINNADVTVYIDQTVAQLTAGDITIELTLPTEYEPQHEELCQRLEYELGVNILAGYQNITEE